LSNLIKEVKDRSLQNILRKVIFSGENVIDAVTYERPEINNDDLKTCKINQLKTKKMYDQTLTITNLTLKQKETLEKFIDILSKQYLSKGDLMQLLPKRNVDTALPIDYVRRIQEIHPNFNPDFHVYDYTKEKFGELLNVAEKIILNLNRVLNDQ